MKKFFKKIWEELKDVKTLIIFLIVVVIVDAGVWLPLLIGLITKDAYWFGIAGVVELFWLAPATPFIPICIGITFAIKKIIFRKKEKEKNGYISNNQENS